MTLPDELLEAFVCEPGDWVVKSYRDPSRDVVVFSVMRVYAGCLRTAFATVHVSEDSLSSVKSVRSAVAVELNFAAIIADRYGIELGYLPIELGTD